MKIGVELSQAHLDLIEIVFARIDQNQRPWPDLCDLPAQFGPYGAPCPSDENASTRDLAQHRLAIQFVFAPAEQFLNREALTIGV